MRLKARTEVSQGRDAGGIVMLCDWLPPDFGAVGQYALGFARELAGAGNHVALVGFSSAGGMLSARSQPVKRRVVFS